MSEYEFQQSGGQGPTVYGAGGGVVSFVPQEGPLLPGSDPLAPVQQEKFQPDAQATGGGGWLPDLPFIDMPWEGSFPELPQNLPDVTLPGLSIPFEPPWEGLVPDLPFVDVVPPDPWQPMTYPPFTIPFEPDLSHDFTDPLKDQLEEKAKEELEGTGAVLEKGLEIGSLVGILGIALVLPLLKQFTDNRR